MPERVKYVGSVAVIGGPSLSFNREIEVGGYHKFRKEISAGSATAPGTATIDLGTGSTDKLKLLAITSSNYAAQVTFKIDTGTVAHKLAEPVLLGGAGIGLIGATIEKLVFSNALPEEVVVEVFVARDPS